MNFLRDKKNIFIYFLIFIISIVIILIYMFYTKYSCFWGDDFWFTRYKENINLLETLSFEKGRHGGGYIGLFLCKLFSYGLPLYLDIHPNDFVGSWHSVIKSIFFVLLLLLMTRFSTFYNRSKTLYVFILLFLASYIFYLGTQSYIILISYNFYRYLFSLLPLSILLYSIYKYSLINYKKMNFFELIIISICAYFVGSSLELIFYLTIFFYFLLIFYNLIILIISKIKNNISFKTFKLDLNYKFYIPMIIMSFIIYLFTSSSGYKEVAATRSMENISITFDVVREFSQLYWIKCFSDIWVYWILFIPLSLASIIIMQKRNEIRKIVVPILFLFSILVVMYSLILCGKTLDYVEPHDFYLYHHNILAVYKILILYPLFILFGYLYKFIKKQNYIKFVIFVFLLIYSICYIKQSIEPIKYEHKNFYEYKKEGYMIEKIMRFYHLNNETPILNPINYPEIMYCMNLNDFEGNIFLLQMNLLFKTNNATRLGIIIDENALEKFYEKGGTFTDEELKELKFERLKDDNFVLNKKEVI